MLPSELIKTRVDGQPPVVLTDLSFSGSLILDDNDDDTLTHIYKMAVATRKTTYAPGEAYSTGGVPATVPLANAFDYYFGQPFQAVSDWTPPEQVLPLIEDSRPIFVDNATGETFYSNCPHLPQNPPDSTALFLPLPEVVKHQTATPSSMH